MTDTTQIAARLPTDLAAEIDRTAAEDVRTRSGQLAWLARIGLAGRARLAELEALAAEGLAAQLHTESQTGTEAARRHLEQHRRLCGEGSDHGS